jgi:NAD dependent epimerase/dehydratase family enzyme
VVLEGQRVLPARLQELGFAFRFPELAPALRDLLTTTP